MTLEIFRSEVVGGQRDGAPLLTMSVRKHEMTMRFSFDEDSAARLRDGIDRFLAEVAQERKQMEAGDGR